MVDIGSKKVTAVFWREPRTGAEPVRDWLKRLPREERKAIGTDIMTVEFGWPVGMPVCRPLGGGLYETRTDFRNRTARVIFCFHEGRMVLLHGFIKKTQKTPSLALKLARTRMLALTER